VVIAPTTPVVLQFVDDSDDPAGHRRAVA